MSAIELVVTHLNAPVGPVLTAAELTAALRAGTTRGIGLGSVSSALIGTMFGEVSVSLILRCIREAPSTIETVNQLYCESLDDSMHRIKEWEAMVDAT